MTTLLDENGEPFASRSVDPEGIALEQDGPASGIGQESMSRILRYTLKGT